jgi:hypothetical protein
VTLDRVYYQNWNNPDNWHVQAIHDGSACSGCSGCSPCSCNCNPMCDNCE